MTIQIRNFINCFSVHAEFKRSIQPSSRQKYSNSSSCMKIAFHIETIFSKEKKSQCADKKFY